MPHVPQRPPRSHPFQRAALRAPAPGRRLPARSLLAGLCALLLAGCASQTKGQKITPGTTPDQEETELRERLLERELPEEPGALLLELDGLLRAWNQTKLSAREVDERKHRALDLDLRRGARQRLDVLIEQIESGPPRNRQIAAMAVGFSGSPRALSPLLAALDDPLVGVRQNALLGLGLLADPSTPLEPLRQRLLEAPEATSRNNAAYALQRLLEAGVREEGLLEDLRLALLDPEPGVRVQAATCLRVLQDPAALPELADRLEDQETLVAVAAARAIRRIGEEVDAERGRCARNLFEAWRKAKGERRDALRYELRILRGADLGEKEEDWREWAFKLP